MGRDQHPSPVLYKGGIALFIDPKKIAWEWTIADRSLSSTPCFVVKVIMVSDGVAAGDMTIRNGQNTGGEVRCVLRAGATVARQYTFSPPMYMSKGLYVDHGSNLDGALVGYIQEIECEE